MATTEEIKALREQTGLSIMQCKKALEEAGGDISKAIIILKKQSSGIAAKKMERKLGASRIACYIHSTGTVGSMVELSTETDFVAKNEAFTTLARDIAMHITAFSPEYLKMEDIKEETKIAVGEALKGEVKDKPVAMQEKIMAGKLDAYFKERVLLEQKYVKDDSLTIRALIENAIQKFGEKIEIVRFTRYQSLGR